MNPHAIAECIVEVVVFIAILEIAAIADTLPQES